MNLVELSLAIHVESFVIGLALGAAFPRLARSVLEGYRGRAGDSDSDSDDNSEPGR